MSRLNRSSQVQLHISGIHHLWMHRTWSISVCLRSPSQRSETEPNLTAVSGVGMFVCTYTYMYIWVYTGEVNAKRVRERYLQAVLRQDIAFFDNVGAGEVATRIQTDTRED